MNRREFCAAAAGGLGLLLTRRGSAADCKFVRLYNGKDLTGWHAQNGRIEVWKADGERIVCTGPGGGWLTTDREYGDFILKVEYRIQPGGNSGIGIRYPGQGDPAHEGMEIQILDDDSPRYQGKLKPAQYNGGIYYQSPPKARAAKKPGEWNLYEIRAQGPRIVVHLNGVEIQNIDVEEFTKAEGPYKPLAQRPRRGFIGLQSHGDPVEFRNIEICEL